MKEKNLIVQNSKGLTSTENKQKSLTSNEGKTKHLSTKDKNTSLIKPKKQENALQKTVETAKNKIVKIATNNKLAIRNLENKILKKEEQTSKNSDVKQIVKSRAADTSKITSPTQIKAKSSSKTTSKATNKTSTEKNDRVTTKMQTKTKVEKSEKTTTKNVKTITRNTLKDFVAHANEYFDLPYRYNETIVKLLAQTPKRLFVYWDISDKDRENYIKTFGDNFFNITTPFLRVKNETFGYTFDVDINDFANSWYIDVNDDNSKYSIELYRRLNENASINPANVSNNSTNTSNGTITDNDNNLNNGNNSVDSHDNSNNRNNDETANINNYIYDQINNLKNLGNGPIFIVSSNKIDAPNGKVISTTYPREIQYRDIKTNQTTYKTIEMPNNEFFENFFKDQYFSTKNDTFTSR